MFPFSYHSSSPCFLRSSLLWTPEPLTLWVFSLGLFWLGYYFSFLLHALSIFISFFMILVMFSMLANSLTFSFVVFIGQNILNIFLIHLRRKVSSSFSSPLVNFQVSLPYTINRLTSSILYFLDDDYWTILG